MTDMRIVKRELVVRLTTEKGSVLYEPVEPCEHGKIDRHRAQVPEAPWARYTCEGAGADHSEENTDEHG